MLNRRENLLRIHGPSAFQNAFGKENSFNNEQCLHQRVLRVKLPLPFLFKGSIPKLILKK
jgi:hypothetical protein